MSTRRPKVPRPAGQPGWNPARWNPAASRLCPAVLKQHTGTREHRALKQHGIPEKHRAREDDGTPDPG